jgi:hypothetical protein
MAIDRAQLRTAAHWLPVTSAGSHITVEATFSSQPDRRLAASQVPIRPTTMANRPTSWYIELTSYQSLQIR